MTFDMCFPSLCCLRTCRPKRMVQVCPFVGARCGCISREPGPGWPEPLTETKSLPPSELDHRQREYALRGSYFRITGISKPRNSERCIAIEPAMQWGCHHSILC